MARQSARAKASASSRIDDAWTKPVLVELDMALLTQLESVMDAESVHTHANLVGAYRTAVAEAQTGDAEYEAIAREAEARLRAMLTEFRLRRAGLH